MDPDADRGQEPRPRQMALLLLAVEEVAYPSLEVLDARGRLAEGQAVVGVGLLAFLEHVVLGDEMPRRGVQATRKYQ